MQAPRLPSIFKMSKVRKFRFPARYYNEREERIENLEKRKKSKIQFRSNRNSGENTGRGKRLIFMIIALVLITYLILK